jgi:hypothetical protein
MSTYSKIPLSSSTNGTGLLVVATTTLGTNIHTAGSGSTNFDEVWAYAMNSASANVKLTMEYGGAATKDLIEITIPAESGLTLILPGLYLCNSLSVTAFAATASVLSIHGYVNRVTA